MAQVILQGQSFQCPRQIWDHAVAAQSAALASNVPMFSVPIGSTGNGVTGRTKYDTNLLKANSLNPGEAFILMQLGFSFNPLMSLADIKTLLGQYYFELSIVQAGSVFADGPLWLYPLGTGIAGMSTNTNESSWNIGIANLMVARAWGLENSIDIVDQTYFGVNLICPTSPTTSSGTSGYDVWCVLDGLKQSLVHG